MFSWEIGVEGRRWTWPEVTARLDAIPGGIEVVDGRMLWSEADRMTLLALLLENVGTQAAVKLGGPDVWRQALEQIGSPGPSPQGCTPA